MQNSQERIRAYLFPLPITEAIRRASGRIVAIIEDSTDKTTEVIREGGYVHGRVSPVPKKGSRS